MSSQSDAEFPAVVSATLRPSPRAARLYRDFAKRLLDLAFVLIVSLPVALAVLILAALVALDGSNPFYGQLRVGRNGKLFRMWKLRTMVPDADAVLEAHLATDPALRAYWDHHQKLQDDPRITRLGRVLRQLSLDELPQFYNVLTGDMSIVGPRPIMPEQRVLYPGRVYYEMRPGLTGFWQISVRNEASFAQRAGFDDAYYGQLSLGTDLRVVARTVGVVLRGTGC